MATGAGAAGGEDFQGGLEPPHVAGGADAVAGVGGWRGGDVADAHFGDDEEAEFAVAVENGGGGGVGRLAEGAFGGGVENAEGGAAAAWLWTVTKPWGCDHAADRGDADVGGSAGVFAVLFGRVASIPDLGEHVGQNAGARVLDLPHERWAGAGAGDGAHGEVVADEVFRAEGEGPPRSRASRALTQR